MTPRPILAALVLAALALPARAQPASEGLAESIKLCSRTAICSFIVGYPAERLLFTDPGAARTPLRSGRICSDGWVAHGQAGADLRAEMTTEGADGVWSSHWTPVGPTQCHRFHSVLNVRLRAANAQSAWRVIYQRMDN